MKKNTILYKMHGEIERTENVLNFRSKFFYCAGRLAAFLYSANSYAQFVNSGDVKVENGTILSIYMDYDNKDTGNFINDGLVHIFENWTNDGVVSFTSTGIGKTFFIGEKAQRLFGSKTSNFQNVLFENYSTLIPFRLSTVISVNKKAEFLSGIIDGDSDNGLVVFNENATHSDASDLSFVDGKVQKKGNEMFEFPVGDELYFRPSYNATGGELGDIYTTQYFLKNSNPTYPHTSKEETIQLIDNAEYWNVTRDQGASKIVLSLTLDARTTPSEFFNLNDDTTIAIVRWDPVSSKWIKEGGVVSERTNEGSKGASYTQLVTGVVSGYGIFTVALVKKDLPPPDDLIVYNAVSPNDDGINDTFHIKGIDKYPDNTVEIYNRWGVKVYEAKSYNESDVMFRGYSDGRVTINRNEKLPTGTYFYILKYNNGKKVVEKAGYLYINNQ
ncbi:gliding motility-associated C-terminal domain-containing protein [Flavobacterium sp. P21]|uniref:gliding motility-associated C-terminal domain-containing protein n=1 Tax=Flavobacterium sp. P21 TaxID=3423948 RepID=UPI003D671A5E